MKWVKLVGGHLRLIYKNMTWKCSKGALVCFVILATMLSFYVCIQAADILAPYGSIGRWLAIAMGFLALSFWFIGIPWVTYVIDMKSNPERIRKVLATIPDASDIRFKRL